jgi:putative glycosyltransferase (TIGR04348 family)
MKIGLITPAGKGSRAGNRTTAVRWAGILRSLGHRVQLATEYADGPADLMVALHAWRSAKSIERFHQLHPQHPLVVALTGTDIYSFIHSEPAITLRSLDLAHALVGLHGLVGHAIPRRYHRKLEIIYQSAPALRPPRPRPRERHWFDILVIGHLRDEKDPLRGAEAARLLPQSSRIRVIHFGRAHEQSWAQRAQAEMARNPRYIWRGEVPHWQVRRAFARAPLMLLSSRLEGGANVISEAVMAGVPVIASAIAGSIGLLGEAYPGYYPVGDTAALARLMRRAEEESGYRNELRRQCAERRPLFRPARERRSWRELLLRLCR